jgi:hypothetical protein
MAINIKYDYKKLYHTALEANKTLNESTQQTMKGLRSRITTLENEKKALQKILYSRDEKRDAFFTEISKELELLRIIKKLTEKII